MVNLIDFLGCIVRIVRTRLLKVESATKRLTAPREKNDTNTAVFYTVFEDLDKLLAQLPCIYIGGSTERINGVAIAFFQQD